MVVFTLTAFFGSTYTKMVASFLAGSATVRVWFAKEIAAGKAEINKISSAVKTDVAKVEADIKKI
jgi:hypothetical protein